MSLASLRSKQISLLEEIKEKKEEAERVIDETQSSYQDSVSDYKVSELASQSAARLISSSHEVIRNAQALLRDNERILDIENKKMEALSAQNTLLRTKLEGWHSQLDVIKAEYSQRSTITEDDLKKQAVEAAQSARLSAIATSQEKLRKLAQH